MTPANSPIKLVSMSATPNQLASTLTKRILAGEIAPGAKLLETALAEELGVSRNTLREGFRIMARDGLVEHIPHRGVFVIKLTPEEVVELFAHRRFIELGALNFFAPGARRTTNSLKSMAKSLASAQAAAEQGDWAAVGNCNNEFHQSLVGLVGIQRLSESLTLIMAQSRLAFMAVGSSEEVHAPFLHRNELILAHLNDGDVAAATAELASYLQESEARILGEMSLGGS